MAPYALHSDLTLQKKVRSAKSRVSKSSRAPRISVGDWSHKTMVCLFNDGSTRGIQQLSRPKTPAIARASELVPGPADTWKRYPRQYGTPWFANHLAVEGWEYLLKSARARRPYIDSGKYRERGGIAEYTGGGSIGITHTWQREERLQIESSTFAHWKN